MEELVTVRQGMQPNFGGVLVGIVKIGFTGGAPAIQVWIRAGGRSASRLSVKGSRWSCRARAPSGSIPSGLLTGNAQRRRTSPTPPEHSRPGGNCQ
ncbi:hypothetical protein [Pseudarthrobacter sp. GA104]|uniref:hypothetical protein n=1 Tax=Pseudarthrobacter sp. GA104 TaxID=2676311 RepID=UPI0012FC80A9|nr:hypothetical protein [Pseudarthrobacter sp. GA104]MUU70495.1 hypothetical protein [Pseudarthrobacter sp. GA104]